MSRPCRHITKLRKLSQTTRVVFDTASARTPRWNSHATPVEVVPDNETFRFGPGAVKKSSRAVIFPFVPFEFTPSVRGGFLVDQHGSDEAIGKRD